MHKIDYKLYANQHRVLHGTILNDVFSSAIDNFNRIHILHCKDIHKIERDFKLDGGQRHYNDATSVAA